MAISQRDGHGAPAPVVVITGASAGVGRALARACGWRGASIGLIARGQEALETTRREIEDAGGKALVCPADAGADEVEQTATLIEGHFGPPDIWINNAMASVFSPITETTPEEFRRGTEVTYLGVVYGTLAALGRMRPTNRGRIVQIGSALKHRARLAAAALVAGLGGAGLAWRATRLRH